ncbi:hypothetical protein MTO96_007517 [Rhipicephalus appendiculatus]
MRVGRWDPMLFVDEQPTPSCLMRVKRDIADFKADPLPGIYISPEERDLTRVHALIVGPDGTPYEGGFFHFFMKFPANYPVNPPRVRIMTTDAGRVRFNPNLYANGKVCLSILGTWEGPPWSPVQCIGSVMVSIQSLLSEDPYYNEPGFTPGTRTDWAKRTSPPMPRDLAEAVLKTFVESYDKYEQLLRSLIEQSKTKTSTSWAQYLGLAVRPTTHTVQYEPLLARLQELYKRVKERAEAQAGAQAGAQA